MKQLLIATAIILTGSFFLGKPAYAAAACTPIYGGGVTCPTNQFTITKTVMNPETNQFVANLGALDPLYYQNDIVPFRITVTNNTTQALTNLVVKDTLPASVGYVSSPGLFDSGNKLVTISVTNLPANQSAIYTIMTKVTINPPDNQGTLCQNNKASATLTGNTVYATSQFCIQHSSGTQVTTPATAQQNPKTGTPLLSILGLLPLAGFGWKLKRARLA